MPAFTNSVDPDQNRVTAVYHSSSSFYIYQQVVKHTRSNFRTNKSKRKIQGVPQLQATAHPRHEEEAETDKPNKRKSNKRTNQDYLSFPQAR